MAKIRTLEELDHAIDEEVAWRKKELTTSLSIITSSQGRAQEAANIRSGILLLYAHWEGWVKNVSRLYIRYVNTQGVTYDRLSAPFLGNALKTRLDRLERSNTAQAHNDFAAFIQKDMTSRASLSEDLIRTESNLSSQIFQDTVNRLGLPTRPIYTSQAALIDNRLVHGRNSIAHGEFLDVDHESFQNLRSTVLEVLFQFTDDVHNCASTDFYLSG